VVGHLFVAHGDLTKLACDGLLIPCDSDGNVGRGWTGILPADLRPSRQNPDWLVLNGQQNCAGMIELPSVDRRAQWAFVTVDVGLEATPKQVVERTWKAINFVSERLTPHDGRVNPLIGIPLAGTGYGGLDTRRAEVIRRLLNHHRSSPLKADIALILRDRRDFAAVQERRKKADWPQLSGELHRHADRLGKLAASGELSLFLGAGVSRPVGLPDWWQLLDVLARKANVEEPSRKQNPFKAAVPIVAALGNDYDATVRRQLKKRQHGVGHALLASLRTKRIVTTNFDCCMELALETPAAKNFRVLTRQLAASSLPWLLKLNGDIRQTGSLVLTTDDLKRYPKERRALEGVVQGLLLTSHLLFVGFSLTDKNFLELADAVSKVRMRAQVGKPSKPGTAVALTADDLERARYTDLHMLTMEAQSPDEGGRLLEIFLDRLVWAASTDGDLASEYILDERYLSGLATRDAALRDVLIEMSQNATADAKKSAGWKRVAECLRDLGADAPA
jgi:hypothetical protein